MKLDEAIVQALTLDASNIVSKVVAPTSWIRIFKREYRKTPLGTGESLSRFSPPPGNTSFQVLYAGADLETALAEVVIRDRFEATTNRLLPVSDLDRWVSCDIRIASPLRLLDIRELALLRLGVNTDVRAAKNQADAQRFSLALYNTGLVDGIIYRSRLSGADCLAIYATAINGKLKANAAVNLDRMERLQAAFDNLGVKLIR